jgi:YfiH family protein
MTGSPDPQTVLERRQRLAAEVGFDLNLALFAVQIHGASVKTFSRSRPQGAQSVLDTDALATDVPGQALVTYHADCVPVLFVDRPRGVVAAAHAGWRGSLKGVVSQTVQALHMTYATDPEDLEVLIGPGICGRCYEVGADVAQPLAARYGRAERYLAQDAGGRPRLDLAALTRLQLEDVGVSSARIHGAGWCTKEEDRWFSHRAGRTGRFLAAIVAP